MLEHGHGFNANAPVLKDISYGDSSDDDIPPPMNFSALTKALLEDKPAIRGRSPQERPLQRRPISPNTRQPGSSRVGTPSHDSIRVTRRPQLSGNESEKISPPRVVHLSGSRGSNIRRTASALEGRSHDSESRPEAHNELITPAPMPRKRPVMSRVNSAFSNGPSSHSSSAANHSGLSSDYQATSYVTQATSIGRDASIIQDEAGQGAEALQGSTRLKRSGLGQGTLRGLPMRRPMRRRESEEGESPAAEEPNTFVNDHEIAEDEGEVVALNSGVRRAQDHVEVHDFGESPPEQSQPQQRPVQEYPIGPITRATMVEAVSTTSAAREAQDKQPLRPVQEKPMFRMPAPPPPLPFMNDQENDPPPTFKRNKPQVSAVLGTKLSVLNEGKELKMLAETPVAQPRQALAMRSINTPQRAAPPPPKMSVLETATAPAGASTVKSKKKRTHVTLNGKVYSLRGRLGKGGSSDVYRVMAENDKMFALKKVNLEDCNEETIRGYKGEIDLLKKLEHVERVVRLFDWEVNEAKKSLSVLMEIGESDLHKVFSTRIHPEDAKLDLCFTRHYWKEMLECVAAVHEHDIVHSDLKPMNFLLVQGRLKLIDFGIADAIDTDNTVNVHRETNVGTPNYMSPESLQDTNSEQRAGGATNVNKLMKVGKPSDVWSLGCVLYQMTYGRPPFAHITNQWNRVMAIINPKVHISYPDTGIGGGYVPASLKRLLRSCLNRDATQRPTVEQLLSEREPFLNPDIRLDKWDAQGAVPVTEPVLEQILMKIVERCRDPKRGIPTDDEVRVYPKAFLDRVKELQKA